MKTGFNLMQKLTIAQALVSAVEEFSAEIAKARADGVVTLGEAITICVKVVDEIVSSGGLQDYPLFETTKRGARKPKQEAID